jgi:hypothetical protein
VYRFDDDIYRELIDTPFDGKLPTTMFYHLPEWCVYIETPHLLSSLGIQRGAFVKLDYDMETHDASLQINIDFGDRMKEFIIFINDNNLQEPTQKYNNIDINVVIRNSSGEFEAIDDGYEFIKPVLPLILYICTQNADLGGRKPELPLAKKTKHGLRNFPPPTPVTWDVGFRLGAAIRNYRANEGRTEGGLHHSPRPHIRRAHWHSFWKGKRNNEENRKIVVKWIPPVPVNLEEGEVIPTIHPIEVYH